LVWHGCRCCGGRLTHNLRHHKQADVAYFWPSASCFAGLLGLTWSTEGASPPATRLSPRTFHHARTHRACPTTHGPHPHVHHTCHTPAHHTSARPTTHVPHPRYRRLRSGSTILRLWIMGPGLCFVLLIFTLAISIFIYADVFWWRRDGINRISVNRTLSTEACTILLLSKCGLERCDNAAV
jgi:hypothetical protein